VVTHAGAAAHPAETHAAAPPPTMIPAPFVERERILQHPQLSGPPPADRSTARPRANAFVPPELAEPEPSTPQQRSGQAPVSPAVLPVYHPAVRPDSGQPEAQTHASAPAYRAPPPSARPAAPAPQQAPAPPPHSSPSRESRDSAAHGDRDSRERVVR
jgi:hypothetical protein